MCRLHENELYRLKFRKKFVKNGQEEMYPCVCAFAGRVLAHKHAPKRTRIRKSTFTNDPLHLSPPRREICLMTENHEKRSVASRIPCFPLSIPLTTC